MINFYRRFIPGATRVKILQPFNDFLKDTARCNASIEWSEQAENNLRESKRALANATMLAHPIPGAPVSLTVDASDYAIGAVLQQRVNDTWQPLGFMRKSLSPAQQKYSAYDRELLSKYTAVKNSDKLSKGGILPFSLTTNLLCTHLTKTSTSVRHENSEAWIISDNSPPTFGT